MKTHSLEQFRQEIDTVDEQIISLLGKRLEIVRKVGIYKAERNIPPLDKGRWREVLVSKMNQAKSLHISEELVEDIYNRIHKEALKIEEKT